MAVRITDLCISCDVCLAECPTTSIVDAKTNPTDENYYYVNPTTCTECIGDHKSPACQAACPISDCIVWDLPYDDAHKEHFENNELYKINVDEANAIQSFLSEVSIEDRKSGKVECIIS